MSWIEDVKGEIKELDVSVKNLRKFAFVVGVILIIVSLWMLLRGFLTLMYYFLASIGMLLIAAGAFSPNRLTVFYRIWMGVAFSMGWIVSRGLLVMIFYFVIIPIGLLSRMFGKEFIDKRFKYGENSYWIKKNMDRKTNYEKMY